MNLGTFYLPKETMLAIMHGIVDGNITTDSLRENPNNEFSREAVRFAKTYLKHKPDNITHNDIMVLS
jgi:hypothetical protein